MPRPYPQAPSPRPRPADPVRALLALIAATAALVSVAGCGSDTGSTTTGDSTTTGASTSTTTATSTSTTSSTTRRRGRALLHGGRATAPGPPPGGTGDDDIERTTRALIAGPGPDAPKDAATEIPSGTKLEGVDVNDGTATVEVSKEFTAGIPADPAERSPDQEEKLDARLAQVTYTLAQFDGVDRTRLVSGGVPVGGAKSRNDFAKPEPKAPKAKLGDPEPKGKASSSVRSLQERLAKLKYLPKGAVDGIDGYRTRQAVTAFQAWEGLQRDGIAGPQTMAALETAKRPEPKGDGPSKRLEVYRDKGVTLLVKKGRTKRAVHTSSGAPGYTTPAGRFEVFRKEVNSWSVPYQVWLPWASYFNAGIAFHAYPDVPAYPASHGCVGSRSPRPSTSTTSPASGLTVIVR